MARGTDCAVHTHRANVPLEDHHIRPKSRGGRNTTSNIIRICSNAHGDAHYLLDAIEDAAADSVAFPTFDPDAVIRALDLDYRRSYSAAVRVIAYKGWQAYGADFLAGGYRSFHRLWLTSGQPRREGHPCFADFPRLSRRARSSLLSSVAHSAPGQ